MNKNMKKGSILVTVMVVVTACTSLALFINEKTLAAYGTVISLQNDYQGAIYAMTAIEALEMAFQYDEASYDAADDIWTQIPTIPLDNGFMTITMKPLNAKVPMATLNSKDEDVKERATNALNELMRQLEITEPDIYELLTWVGASDPTGERFDENGAPYSMKSAQLRTLAELIKN